MIGAKSYAKVGFSLIRAAGLQACTMKTKTTKNLFMKTMAASQTNPLESAQLPGIIPLQPESCLAEQIAR
jgi:hypothetical protein